MKSPGDWGGGGTSSRRLYGEGKSGSSYDRRFLAVAIVVALRMSVSETQAMLKNVGRRGSADLHHIYVA